MRKKVKLNEQGTPLSPLKLLLLLKIAAKVASLAKSL